MDVKVPLTRLYILMQVALIFIFTVASPAANAQQGYKPGFLLNERLDTVPGFIRFTGKAIAPTPCLFKTNLEAQPKEVYPGTIHGFCLADGSYFYSRSVGSNPDVFLEVLVKGYMNLFKFGDVYYVEKGDSALFELSDELELVYNEGQRQQVRGRNFTRMISLLVSDCPEVTPQLKKIRLRDKSLVRLVSSYNQCRGSSSQVFRVKPKESRSSRSR